MVTKLSRMVQRKTLTPGKVPAPSEVLEAEICINLPDRQMYSKDQNGQVFKIAGIGREIGDNVGLESYLGARTIFTREGLQFRPEKPDGTSYANVQIMKDINVGADPGPVSEPNPNVNFNLLVRTDIRESMRSFQWNGIFSTVIHPGVHRKYDHGDEPVVLGATLAKFGDIPAWCFYTSTEDLTTNPIYATLGWELGFKVNGPDPNKRRIVIDAQLNSIDDREGYTKYGNNEIAVFLNISPSLGEPERVILHRAIVLKGRVGVGLDMTETTAHSRENIALPPGGFISWKENPTAALNAKLGWSAGIGWQMHGLAVSPSAVGGTATLPANPDSFISIEVSPGVTRKIPVYR